MGKADRFSCGIYKVQNPTTMSVITNFETFYYMVMSVNVIISYITTCRISFHIYKNTAREYAVVDTLLHS